jgi:hypothetical protein
LYPFQIQHLGKQVYTLYTYSVNERDTWREKISHAMTKHAKALSKQQAEPFRLRVLAHSTGSTTARSKLRFHVPGTPLDHALTDYAVEQGRVERNMGSCAIAESRATINCATTFWYHDRCFVAVGSDAGVHVSQEYDVLEAGNIPQWLWVGFRIILY